MNKSVWPTEIVSEIDFLWQKEMDVVANHGGDPSPFSVLIL